MTDENLQTTFNRLTRFMYFLSHIIIYSKSIFLLSMQMSIDREWDWITNRWKWVHRLEAVACSSCIPLLCCVAIHTWCCCRTRRSRWCPADNMRHEYLIEFEIRCAFPPRRFAMHPSHSLSLSFSLSPITQTSRKQFTHAKWMVLKVISAFGHENIFDRRQKWKWNEKSYDSTPDKCREQPFRCFVVVCICLQEKKKTLKLRPTKISTINSHDLKSASDSKLLWLLLVLLFCFLSRLENVVRHHFCIIIKNWTTALMRMHHSQNWINLFIYESRKTLVCWSPFCLTTQSSAIGNNRTEIDLCPRRRWLWCAQDKQHATREFEVPHWEIACTRIE